MSLAPILGAVAAGRQLVSAGIQYVGGVLIDTGFNVYNPTTHAVGGLLTGGVSADTAAGDLVVVAYGIASTNDQSGKSIGPGYSSLYTTYVNTTNDANLTVAYGFASGPGLSIELGAVGGSADAFGRVASVQVFRGVNASTPFDVTGVSATGTDSRPNPASITPITAGAYILAVGVGANSTGAPATNFSSSNLTDFLTTTNAGTLRTCALGCGIKDNWLSGAFDPALWGGTTATASGWAAFTMALRPA